MTRTHIWVWCELTFADKFSWAVLNAFQNLVHTLQDARPTWPNLPRLKQLYRTAQTSCYWYWTGQHTWDTQVTNAANDGYGLARQTVEELIHRGEDRTAPAIFPPWVDPPNPGGPCWGENQSLETGAAQGHVHTFVSDLAGLASVRLVIRSAKGESTVEMKDLGPYPSRTGASLIGHHYRAPLPVGVGHIRYFIVAEDTDDKHPVTAAVDY